MQPVVALVGRPNVGKSTLFNRLTQTKDALVADFPGLTRDRQYGRAWIDEAPFIVIDTGGIGVDDAAVDELMSAQSTQAILEADLVFFMVEAQSGLTGVDRALAAMLRKQNTPVYLVINKIDGVNDAFIQAEFMPLGFSETFSISATHGTGIQKLLGQFALQFKLASKAEDTNMVIDNDQDASIRVAVIGRPNVGKSTLINRILGEERMVVYDMPGTTRDSIECSLNKEGQHYIFIDTAGVRRRARVHEKIEKFSIVKTLTAVEQSNVCLLLMDATQGVTEQDMHLIGYIIESGRGLVVAFNKWDGLDLDHKTQVKENMLRKLRFAQFAKFHFISALHGSGVGNLFKDINEAYESAVQGFSTSKLTTILEQAVTSHPPPLHKGRRIKLRYAHAGGRNPPIIVIHGNQVDALADSYKRYLTKTFIEALGLVGTPLKVTFKSSENPFQGKKNQLSTRQIKSRKRLMRFVKKGKH